jgi:hypothetical protein
MCIRDSFILAVLITLLITANFLAKKLEKPRQGDLFEPENVTTPTPIPTVKNKVVPPEYQSRFDQIDGQLRENLEFMPPTIDTQIGL